VGAVPLGHSVGGAATWAAFVAAAAVRCAAPRDAAHRPPTRGDLLAIRPRQVARLRDDVVAARRAEAHASTARGLLAIFDRVAADDLLLPADREGLFRELLAEAVGRAPLAPPINSTCRAPLRVKGDATL
jgi:hypothetical protein